MALSSTDAETSPSLSLDEIERLVRPIAESEPRLVGLYLFGSRAHGEEHIESDVDLGALFSETVPVFEQLSLEDRFEQALGRRVDLIDMRHAKPFLALDVIRGERLYESDGLACDEFDLFVLRRAGDLAPFERQRRAMRYGAPDA